MVTGSTGPGLPARIAARSRCRHGNDDAAHLEDFRRLLSRWQIPGQVSHLGNANLHCAVVVLLGPCDVCVGRPTSTDHLCRLDSRPVSDSSDTKSTSRRCHNVWHGPRSNGMRRESTGAHFTLKLAESGRRSVGGAWFKSPLAQSGTRCRLRITDVVLAPTASDATCNYPMPGREPRLSARRSKQGHGVQPSHAAPAFIPPSQKAAAINGNGTTHSGLRLIQRQPSTKSTSQTPMKTPTAQPGAISPEAKK
jgi:hypothetical protein